MKNLFRFFLVALFIVGLVYTADAVSNDYASQNAEMSGVSGGATGITPPVKIMKVRYSLMTSGAGCVSDANISSGDVLVWDTTSADGITVTKDIVDAPSDTVSFAGVAVTDILTADSTGIKGIERNWGYMAIKGYCLAKVDTSESTTAQKLALGGGTLGGAFQTAPQGLAAVLISQDIGQLLNDTASDGLMPVQLK